MIKTREIIQEEAFQAAKANGYNCTLAMSTGVGKSKVAIWCIQEGDFHNVLITSPRTNLKDSWIQQLNTWAKDWGFCSENEVTIENIQTAYKFNEDIIKSFDLIIVDEVHCISFEYIAYLRIANTLGIPVLCLTATPFKEDEFKRDNLYKLFPIIYEYYSAESDSIVNKCRYIIYEYELTDEFKVLAGTKDKKWLVGEKTQYEYLTKQYENGKKLMAQEGASDYFSQSLLWMKSGSPNQRVAGATFFRAVKNRKDFLGSLTSSVTIAKMLKEKILEDKNNKLLLFCESTFVANKLSDNVIHSNVTTKTKDTAYSNASTLDYFNKGVIRDIASCLSLTLGLNMIGVNWVIYESYYGSKVNALQRKGRANRLSIDEVANIIIIKVKNTQMETWFNKAFDFITESEIINNVNDLKL